MSGLIPYLFFDGTAAEALTRYHEIFGGTLHLYDYQTLGRTDGPPEAIGHGMLIGDVELAAADAATGEPTLAMTGLRFSLLGTKDPGTLTQWFDELAQDGTITDPLQKRAWGDYDGTVVDKFGVSWLIGYQIPESASPRRRLLTHEKIHSIET